MGNAEEEATGSHLASMRFSVERRQADGLESATPGFDGSWDGWPPVALAENDHILVWWLPEYDDALRQLVARYQWAWREAALPHLEALIPETVLRAWRDSDPLCQEYAWYNVLGTFAAARAKQLGMSPRPATQKVCSCCSREFLESDVRYRFITRIGVEAIDVCATCLRQALDVKGSSVSAPDAITAVLQALSGALGRPPKTSDLNGRLDLHGLSHDNRSVAVQALRVKPTVARVMELFGSWEAALAQAEAAPPIPLPQYQSPPPTPTPISEFTSHDPARYRSLMGPVPEVDLDSSREPWTYRDEIASLIGAGCLALAEGALRKLSEQDSLFSDLRAWVYGQTAREQEARAAISAAVHGHREGDEEPNLDYLLRPRDVRTITSGPVFYEPLPSPPRGNVCFVLVGGPMEYVDLRGQHGCISGEAPEGGVAAERAESVARMSAMVDGEPWMQAATEAGQAIIASLARAGMATPAHGHLMCYVTTPFRQVVKALTGSLPKKLAEDAWSIGPVGKSRWSYQREAGHYIFNAHARFTFISVESAPAVCIWGWPDRSDSCLQAFLDTVAAGTPDPVTVILPDVPAYRDFARRYVRGEPMAQSERTLIEDHLYRFPPNMPNKRGNVLTAEFAPRLVIHPDGSEDDGALLTGAIAYLDAHHTLRLSVWDLLRDGLLREVAFAAGPAPSPFSVTASDWADMVNWYGRLIEYDEPDVLLRLFLPSLLEAVTAS